MLEENKAFCGIADNTCFVVFNSRIQGGRTGHKTLTLEYVECPFIMNCILPMAPRSCLIPDDRYHFKDELTTHFKSSPMAIQNIGKRNAHSSGVQVETAKYPFFFYIF